ncbi:ribonuclease 3-like protein 2 [Rhodamnia argentea]|uniref:Ribonuclease 3-like protein 2 n=1 Tax=Rhodamnia argentea TaxID=178133 RepID=A0A8B8Q9C3_9MYRT|nr:ribonuclease 3-like protein 2 [Rhodamnia argentea]XP_030542864.1 ribonuclease 3-like protein 2 [Rhodamnia argentea]
MFFPSRIVSGGHAPFPPPSPERSSSVSAVEVILNYKFKNPKLLEEALTHSSFPEAPSYERLEFVGDSVLELAVSNHLFLAYPGLDQGRLSNLRSVNVSTEKLARVAVRHGLYRFLRHNVQSMDDKVREFARAVEEEDDAVAHGGSIKAPKVLADIVESVAAAIYIDVDFDLQRLWVIFRGLLEPIVGPEELQQQPQPITMLFEVCQKQGKKVEIRQGKKGSTNIASVHVDGKFVASCSSEHKEIAKLNAARRALSQLAQSEPVNRGIMEIDGFDGPFEIEGAKQKLHELCDKKKWPKPIYRKNESGPPHSKSFVCTVQIATDDGVLTMMGEKRSRVKDAENCAASLMCRALQEYNYL